MLRLAIIIIFAATVIGALMPSSMPAPADDRREVIQVADLEENQPKSQEVDAGSGAVTLDRSYDGHFYADARVNGATVHFLVDTGATGIALSADDARRAGLAFDTNGAEVIGTGASGAVMGHWVKLNRVELGLKSVSDTPAVILAGGDRSLLGQSFLSEFSSVEVHGDSMVLR
ncbi:MAG TPA: TIGR02281 family clan AA aspartic protease [Sphingomicrobium sp.]|jgi:aspartyl protease family protein|nr:TIGR02281 family clan AA aspartic protease [Sphingomicrobium sp.]